MRATVLRAGLVAVCAVGAIVLPGGAPGAVPPSQCQAFTAPPFGPHDLQAEETTRLTYVAPAGTDSVSGTATLDGHPGWAFFFNNLTGSAVTNPRLTVASGLDPAVFDGGLMTPSFPSSCSLPTLDSGQQLQIFPGLEATGLHSTFNLGYDSTRSVSPAEVPVGGGDVTATFTVKIVDPKFADGFVSLFIQGPGATVVSQSDPTNLDQGEDVSSSLGRFDLGGLELGKTYVFTAVLHVENPPFGRAIGPWTFTPSAQIYVSARGDGCTQCGLPGSSVTIADSTLDGSSPGVGAVTFAVDESNRLWDITKDMQYVTSYEGGFFPDADATLTTGTGLFGGGLPATTDSVAAGTSLGIPAIRYWGLNMQNFQQDAITSPMESLASGYDPSQFFDSNGVPATALPFVFSQDSLQPGNNFASFVQSSLPATLVPGCDTTRSISPLSVPTGGGQQTVTVTFRCTDSGITDVAANFGLQLPGATLIEFDPPSNLDEGEELFGPSPPSPAGFFGLNLQNIVTGKTYTATFVLQVPNPYGIPFADKPMLKVVEDSPQPTGCFGCGGPTTSVTLPVASLDGPTAGAGSVTFSAAEPHVWRITATNETAFALSGTNQRNLGYMGPASGVRGQPVELLAVFDDDRSAPGIPVTFTLGSQSCSAVTDTGTTPAAVCTIVLDQPVGSYTLQVSSPGDVDVYPASTSAPFAITGPTSTDQCKNGGWKAFGSFKNEGDCVSYVATGGKNPPAGP